jgi:uncharacterized membrane protein YfcA
MLTTLLLLAPFVFLAFSAEAAIGFGATVIFITLGSNFYPIAQLVPITVPFNILIGGYLCTRYRHAIDFGLLFKRILPLMGGGICIGLMLYPVLREVDLKRLFGLLVSIYAARELYLALRPPETPHGQLPAFWSTFWFILAGITHATYATGGPMLVYVVGRLGLSKAVFRATMLLVWCLFNTVLSMVFLFNGRMGVNSLKITAGLLPALAIGIIFGEYIHDKVSEEIFRRLIFGLLLFSGIVLLF